MISMHETLISVTAISQEIFLYGRFKLIQCINQFLVLVLEDSWQTPVVVVYHCIMDNTEVNYDKRFLKQPRDGASAMSLSKLFHCGTVRGNKEFL